MKIKTFLSNLSSLVYSEKKKLFYLLFFISIGTLFEIIGITILYPFISFISDPNITEKNFFLKKIFYFFGIKSYSSSILFISAIFIIAFLLANILKSVVIFKTLKYVNELRYIISYNYLKLTMNQSYEFFLNNNKNNILKNILIETDIFVQNFLQPLIKFFSDAFTLTFILIFLLFFNLKASLIAIIFFTTIYFALFYFVRKGLVEVGKNRHNSNRERFRNASDAIEGLVEIKLNQKIDIFLNQYLLSSKLLSKSLIKIAAVKNIPKYFVEFLVVFIFIIFLLSILLLSEIPRDKFWSIMLPSIGVYMLAIFRVYPMFHNIYNCFSSMRANYVIVENLSKNIDAMKKTILINQVNQKFKFNNVSIFFENVSFGFNKKIIVENLNLKININEKIFIFGDSGSGKTTFVNLFTGQLNPSSGNIKIGDILIQNKNINSWQKNISYLPQKPFLLDTSIAENIAIGEKKDEINFKKLRKAIKLANLNEFISNLENSYFTNIGQHGLKISGGQQQRIGLARSFYNDKKILILDEATNSLDSKNEINIIKNLLIEYKDRLIIFISHNTKLKNMFDSNYQIKKGKLFKK